MAYQVYQFTFGFTPSPSLTTAFQTSGVTAWQLYQQPNYSNGQVRTGGPNRGNNPSGPSGNYLVANPGDTVFINLVGPKGWVVPSGSLLQVIVSQAPSPATGQGYSPFTGGGNPVAYSLSGTLMADGVTMQYQLPNPIPVTLNPGPGNFARYELTVAFAAGDGSGNVYYFSDDPEMDVQGT